MICLCQFDSQAPFKESKKVEEKLFLPYTALGMSLERGLMTGSTFRDCLFRGLSLYQLGEQQQKKIVSQPLQHYLLFAMKFPPTLEWDFSECMNFTFKQVETRVQ